MKKSKLSLGLIACLLSVGSLAGCDPVKSSDDGVLLSYTVDGTTKYKVADDILKEYYDDSSKYQAIFDSIFTVIKRNYFSKDRGTVKFNGVNIKLGKPQMTKINAEADRKVAEDKQNAQDKAKADGTRYKKEFEAILKEKGVKTEEELHAKYVGELQEETFDENFYTYHVGEMRGDEGSKEITLSNGKKFIWNGYLQDQSPYHMSHLMIELADTSDTNYSNGTISKENAQSLWTVLRDLKTGGENKSFKNLAYTYSDDESSRAKSGDLGIMDYDTSFINEFKLGIYAYEQFYLGKDASGTSINASSFSGKYKEQVQTLFNLDDVDDIPTVSFDTFSELNSVAEKESDANKDQVLGGAALLFPRNVVYNKYLNRHAVFFIEGTDADGNFAKIPELDNKFILCADDDATKPIVAVRGSSGGKQEIHFMVVNRSPLTTYTVADKDYYTTYYYRQDMYPHEGDTKLDTYTNFIGDEKSDSEPRAQEIASKLKSYDSDKLNKYIFLKYAQEEGLTFTKDCKEIEKALMNWILTSAEKKSHENDENWKKTWNEYLDKLVRQNAERNKLIPQACKILYDFANDDTQFLKDVIPFADLSNEDKELIRHNGRRVMDGINAEGVIVPADKDGEVSDTEIERYWNKTKITNAFKKLGGVCNDGEEHI